MGISELLIISSTALVITGHETYGIVAFFVGLLGALIRSSLEIQSKNAQLEAINNATKEAENKSKEATTFLLEMFKTRFDPGNSNKNFN
jgi:hypothetical protein